MTSRQKGSALVVVLAFIGVLVSMAAVLGLSYVSAYNTGNQLENKLKAEYENNQNILANYSQKVLEAAQVPDMMRDDIIKITREAIQGRYGPGGAKAAFLAITEQNPHASEQLYIKLQQIIEAGRDEFKNGQTRLIDTKRVYETTLGSFWQGMFMKLAGYPKVDLSKYAILSTDAVKDAFKKGVESGPIQLRPKQ